MRPALVVVAALVVLPLVFALGGSLAATPAPEASRLAECRADLAHAQAQTQVAQELARNQTTMQLRMVKAMETCSLACADQAAE